MKNKTMQEINEQFKDCPIQVNEYEVDGKLYRVTSHFVGDSDINDVMLRYAENRAGQFMTNMLMTEFQELHLTDPVFSVCLTMPKMYNIRFIALNDGIDTANSDSASMDMMPIMNVFNEWHAANTSKKLRAVFESNAKSGKYMTTFCAYGYEKGTDENFTPVIDPYAADIVRRIFEMRASGMNAKKIANFLNGEHIVPPLDYKYDKLCKKYPLYSHHLWSSQTIKRILKNQIYLGHLCQMKQTTVSYKNHKGKTGLLLRTTTSLS